MAQVYNAMGRQATLLAYMDQFRMLGVLLLLLVPLVFFLKRPPHQGKIELDAH
jgi:DHA2 family multidrug resistance protein